MVYLAIFIFPLLTGVLLLVVTRGIKLQEGLSGQDLKPTVAEDYFFRHFIPNLVGGFLFFAYGDTICLKFKLYKNFYSYRQTGNEDEDWVGRNASLWDNDYIYNSQTNYVEVKNSTETGN